MFKNMDKVNCQGEEFEEIKVEASAAQAKKEAVAKLEKWDLLQRIADTEARDQERLEKIRVATEQRAARTKQLGSKASLKNRLAQLDEEQAGWKMAHSSSGRMAAGWRTMAAEEAAAAAAAWDDC